MTTYCSVQPKQILKLLNKKTQSGFRADEIKNKNIISEEKPTPTQNTDDFVNIQCI